MTVGFDDGAVLFDVLADSDGRLPDPESDDAGVLTYSASLMLASGDALEALRAYVSGVDVLPAMGGGGILLTKRGRGQRHLTYPTGNGEDVTRYAILTECSSTGMIDRDSARRADVVFILGEIIA